MKIYLESEDCRSSEGSGCASCYRGNGKGKSPKRARRPAEKHPHESDAFVTCCDRDGQDRGHGRENTSCMVGVAGAGGRGGNDTPPGSDGEGPPPSYHSRESTPCRSPP